MQEVKRYISTNGNEYITKEEAIMADKKHLISSLVNLDYNEFEESYSKNKKKAWETLKSNIVNIIYNNIDKYIDEFYKKEEVEKVTGGYTPEKTTTKPKPTTSGTGIIKPNKSK